MTAITKLGKYLIRRELGKGAMGVVYEGFDPSIERTVAIKTILPQQLVASEAADVLARFRREAQAAGRLNHPGIVAVYDYDEIAVEDDRTLVAGADPAAAQESPVAFIAMEFVKGRELRDYFEANERFALAEVARLMRDMLAALAHAHDKGVVHRDIKPANLIVLDNGQIKIADFGIARIEKSELTQLGTVMGTPAYMSPEQFMGQPVDGRSDLFSCGVVLYQFLTGEKPFTGNHTTIMYKVLNEEPLAPSMLNVALPAALDGVVKKAMAKAPDQRFQSAAEFAAALDAAVSAQVGAAPAQGALEATLVQPRLAPAAQPASAAAPASRKNIWAAALLALAVLLPAGIYVALRNPAPGADTAAAPQAGGTAPASRTAPPAALQSTSDPAPERGTLIVSALGLANPEDPRFHGDAAAAQQEARADARRQLVEKALALHVESGSLNQNYAVLESKLLSQSGHFIKTVLQEDSPSAGKDGLLAANARAVVNVRELQKSLNQLSRDERINFIRNHGDPKVALRMTLGQADSTQALPPARSQLAENVLKERIKSFGFRVWSADGAMGTEQSADFLIQGEAKLKQLSARLPSSGLTITKTALTSWTVKATDQATGEEIYLNTVLPAGKSWASEDLALADIGKLMGDEFSKNFFLQYFQFGVSQTSLSVSGLPDALAARQLLHELRGMRQVLDVQMLSEQGQYRIELPQGRVAETLQTAVVAPLNAKMGASCFALGQASEREVSLSYAPACADATVRARLDTMPPAGLLAAPDARGKPLLKPSKPQV